MFANTDNLLTNVEIDISQFMGALAQMNAGTIETGKIIDKTFNQKLQLSFQNGGAKESLDLAKSELQEKKVALETAKAIKIINADASAQAESTAKIQGEAAKQALTAAQERRVIDGTTNDANIAASKVLAEASRQQVAAQQAIKVASATTNEASIAAQKVITDQQRQQKILADQTNAATLTAGKAQLDSQRLATEQIRTQNALLRQQAMIASGDKAKPWITSEQAHAAGRVGDVAMMTGAAMLGGVGFAGYEAAGFQSSMVTTRNNMAPMSDADFAAMQQRSLDYGTKYGVDPNAVGRAYFRASNFGFDRAHGGDEVVDAGVKSAMAFGADPEETTRLVASAMKVLQLDKSQAYDTMNVLHNTAQRGDMDMSDLVENFKPVLGAAAPYGLTLGDLAPIYTTLTQHGQSAALAATQVRNLITRIASPHKEQQKVIDEITAQTGIDLTGDFSGKGLQTKGLQGVISDIYKAAGNHPDLINKIINSQRGGIPMSILTSTAGYNDLQANSKVINTDQIAIGVKRQTDTVDNQVKRLQAQGLEMFVKFGPIILPQISRILTIVTDLITKLEALPRPVKDIIVQTVEWGGSLLLIGGLGLKVLKFVTDFKSVLGILKIADETSKFGAFAGSIKTAMGFLGGTVDSVASLRVGLIGLFTPITNLLSTLSTTFSAGSLGAFLTSAAFGTSALIAGAAVDGYAANGIAQANIDTSNAQMAGNDTSDDAELHFRILAMKEAYHAGKGFQTGRGMLSGKTLLNAIHSGEDMLARNHHNLKATNAISHATSAATKFHSALSDADAASDASNGGTAKSWSDNPKLIAAQMAVDRGETYLSIAKTRYDSTKNPKDLKEMMGIANHLLNPFSDASGKHSMGRLDSELAILNKLFADAKPDSKEQLEILKSIDEVQKKKAVIKAQLGADKLHELENDSIGGTFDARKFAMLGINAMNVNRLNKGDLRQTSLADQIAKARHERVAQLQKRPFVVNVNIDGKLLKSYKDEVIDEVMSEIQKELSSTSR